MESKPYVEFMAGAQGWRDCLIDTRPLVHKRELSGVCGVPVVHLQLKLLASHRLIMHSQEVSWLRSNSLQPKTVKIKTRNVTSLFS